MPSRVFIPIFITAFAALASAAPVTAQAAVSGRATLVVGDLLSLRPAPPAPVGWGGPSDADSPGVDEAMRVEVVANRRWQLNAVVEVPGGRSWTAAAIATGGPGRTPLVLELDDLLLAAGAEAISRPTVRLTLSPL